jgi:hypothetical protein
MRNRSLIAAGLLCLALAACSGVTQTIEQAIPPAPKTPQQTVYEVKAALISTEDAALAWAGQICPTASSCTDKRVAAVMQGVISADTIVNSAEAATQANASTSSTAIQAANDASAALTALQAILTQYGVTTSATSTKAS